MTRKTVCDGTMRVMPIADLQATMLQLKFHMLGTAYGTRILIHWRDVEASPRRWDSELHYWLSGVERTVYRAFANAIGVD